MPDRSAWATRARRLYARVVLLAPVAMIGVGLGLWLSPAAGLVASGALLHADFQIALARAARVPSPRPVERR